MIKYMSIKEFYEKGLLQELNRQFLHPLGLALEVVVPEEGSEEEYRFGKVWDYRDDPEGLRFGEETLSSEKAKYGAELFEEKAKVRMESYGWVIQPIEWVSTQPVGEE
jgi:hypothetical protein